MSVTQKCPECGADQAGDAFDGLCPVCMVRVLREIPSAVPAAEKPGDTIACYKLLEQLGEGGCGVVYMASQEAPVRRTVALKVIKLGMDTQQVVARFEAERQALALMDHPNIARVIDAGATETGRPFFVMELVRGIKITDYCDKHQLSTVERLELFIQVCQAIQHAHQKGIIHRDLKPSNILVAQHDTVAVPKVIDFGIAKATSDQRLTDLTMFTAFEQFMGTPAYMSPEQAQLSGLDIDTRTDIYSLGVLLYELLTGQTPFDAKELLDSGLDAMRRTICEKQPARPSTRLRQTLLGSTSSSKLATGHLPLATDLDWVVMKCLEKDRSRRYETANGLAADLKRHLGNEPVVARPPSMAYRFQKMVRRNRVVALAVAAVVIVLVLGAVVSTWQAFEAGRARDAQKQESERANRGEFEARQRGYASDMNLAHQAAVQEDDFGRALELLDRHRPNGKSEIRNSKSETGEDLRGWEWRYLWRQCQSEERFILGEHEGGATAVGMLKDGKTVFSAGRDKCVRLWGLESRRQIGLLPHAEAVIGAAASPDGRWLATATEKNFEGQPLRLWDLATHKSDILTDKFMLRAGSITFSPDSKWLAFATIWGGLRLWDVEARREVADLPALAQNSFTPLAMAFSPDSRTLAYNENDDGDILLWDIACQLVVGRLIGHQSFVITLAFSPDGSTLASGSDDKTARVWNVADRRELFPFTNRSGGFTSLAFSPDGRTLAMSGEGGAGRVIRLVDVATGNTKVQLRGHRSDISGLAFTPDGQSLLSASTYGGSIRVWDVAPGAKEKLAHPFPTNSISAEWHHYGPALFLSPDGRHLLTVYDDKNFSVWDTLRFAEGKPHPLPSRETTMAALAPGGTMAAFGTRNGEVILWDAKRGQARPFAHPDTKRIHLLAFSPDGRYLAAVDDTKLRSAIVAVNETRTIRVWNVSAPAEPQVISSGGEFPVSMTFSADSRALIAGHFEGPVRLWPLDGKGEAVTIPGPFGWVEGLALLPDGLTLISAVGSLRFWDVRTRQENAPNLSPRAGGFSCLALSPDGRRLAAGIGRGPITIWDVASRQEVATIEGHNEAVTQLAFTPDGDDLVSVSKDQLRVWRAASWTKIEATEKEARK